MSASYPTKLRLAFRSGNRCAFPGCSLELTVDGEQSNLAVIGVAAHIEGESGALESYLGSLGDLEAERVRLEGLVEDEREALASFKVHRQYDEIQAKADDLTEQLHALANRNVTERRRLHRYMDAIKEESPPSQDGLERLYKEVGLVFPDALKSTLEDARSFHSQIIKNRSSFLQQEIERLQKQARLREHTIKQLTEERATPLTILSTHGALQELTGLQEHHVQTRGKLEDVQRRISQVRDLSSRKREIRAAKADLAKDAERDHEDRRARWIPAIRAFNENSEALYDAPGRLVINISDTGYKYHVEIERSESAGIGKMKLFCFDLMLSQLFRKHNVGVDFLIHDSVIFDGVDSRQQALAIERAAEVSAKNETQYICALNSDAVPSSDFSDGFDFDSYVRLVLTDEDYPSGALLGTRFENASAPAQ